MLRPYNTVKFDSPAQSKLCVVRAAVHHPLKLNRDVLNLLLSPTAEGPAGGDWDPSPVVYDMQEKELTRLGLTSVTQVHFLTST